MIIRRKCWIFLFFPSSNGLRLAEPGIYTTALGKIHSIQRKLSKSIWWECTNRSIIHWVSRHKQSSFVNGNILNSIEMHSRWLWWSCCFNQYGWNCIAWWWMGETSVFPSHWIRRWCNLDTGTWITWERQNNGKWQQPTIKMSNGFIQNLNWFSNR